MSLRRHATFIIVMAGMLCTLGLAIKISSVQAAPLGDNAPYGPNSVNPATGQKGMHVFYLRKHPTQGRQENIRLSAFYPAGVPNWDNQYLSIATGGGNAGDSDAGGKYVCKANSSGRADVDDNYVTVTIIDALNTSNRAKYTIKRSNVCREKTDDFNNAGTNVGNQLYARYHLPNKPASKDGDTGMYKLFINIDYDPGVPKDAGGTRLIVTSPTDGIKIGQRGGDNLSFPLLTDWNYHVNNSGPTRIVVPFGLQCDAAGGAMPIKIYDADNGLWGALTLTMEVNDVTNPDAPVPVQWSVPVPDGHGTTANGKKTFIPDDNSVSGTVQDGTSKSFANIDMIPDHQYELWVYSIGADNTIDLQLPENTETIFGDVKAQCNTPDVPKITYIKAHADGGSEGEPGDPMTFTQSATVSNFPQVWQWGYTEKAIKRGTSAGIKPNRADYDALKTDPGNATKWRECANNNVWKTDVNSCGGSASEKNKWQCQNGEFNTNCDTSTRKGYNWKCTFGSLPDKFPGWDRNTPGCGVAELKCRDTNGIYKANGDVMWASDANVTNYCNNKWNCPDPSQVPSGYGADDSSVNCLIFICANNDNPTDRVIRENQYYVANPDWAGAPGDRPQDLGCGRRCSNGAGEKPPRIDADDVNCYIQPRFNIKCQWFSEPGQPGTNPQEVNSTNSTSKFCASQANTTLDKSGAFGAVKVTTRSIRTSGWSSPEPGEGVDKDGNYKRRATWSFQFEPEFADAYGTIGTKPYLKVFNGDVNSGRYARINGATAECLNAAGNISTWNRDAAPNFYGSGNTDGVVAAGNIDGFHSRNTQATLSAKGLTFANSGTDVYGGTFGTVPMDCSQINEDLTSPKTIKLPDGNTKANVFIGNPNKIQGDSTYVIRGDLYIDQPGLKYDPDPVDNVTKLPRLKIIVIGNIYINRLVDQLDGIYIAIDTPTGTGGNIYTCAEPGGGGNGEVVPTGDRYSKCATKLVINGALAAKSVKFHRTWGTLKNSVDDPTDPLTAVSGSKAAEIINYGPSVWLPRSSGASAEYKTITSLPPVF